MSAPPAKKQTLVWVLLILLALIWGSSFILIKRGLLALTPGAVGALRIVAAGLVLSPLAWRQHHRLHRRHWFWVFVVGFMGSFIPAFLFAVAETGLDSALAGVLNALTPLFAVVVGALFFSRRFTRSTIFGLTIGFAGTLLLITAGGQGLLGNLNRYALYVIAATVCYGFNVNIIKYKLADLGAVALTSWSMLLVLPVAAIYLFFFTPFGQDVTSHPQGWAAFGYIVLLGIMSTAVAMTLFNKLVQLSSPVFASSVTYLIPVVAVIWGLLDHEALALRHYAGMAIILLGVYITNR